MKFSELSRLNKIVYGVLIAIACLVVVAIIIVVIGINYHDIELFINNKFFDTIPVSISEKYTHTESEKNVVD